MKRWLLIGIGGIAALVLLVTVAGLFVPKSHEARVEVRLTKTPEEVWAVVTDWGRVPEWFSGVTSASRIADTDGRETWAESYGGFEATVVLRAYEPPRRVVREVTAGAGFTGSWSWELTPEGAGTRLALTERGTVANPLFRGMMIFADQTRTAREYVAALTMRLGVAAEPLP